VHQFDFNLSTCVAVYAECIYVLTEHLKYLSIRRHSCFFQGGTLRGLLLPVNCACFLQLFQQLINSTGVMPLWQISGATNWSQQ